MRQFIVVLVHVLLSFLIALHPNIHGLCRNMQEHEKIHGERRRKMLPKMGHMRRGNDEECGKITSIHNSFYMPRTVHKVPPIRG